MHSLAFNARLQGSRDGMIKGIAMAKVEPDQQEIAYRSIKEKEGVLDLYPVSGEYDFIMIVGAEDFARMNGLINEIQEGHRTIKARFIGRLR